LERMRLIPAFNAGHARDVGCCRNFCRRAVLNNQFSVMAQFSYKARRRSGEVVQGVLDVADRTAALTQIERLGLFPVAVEAAKGAAVAKAERAERKATSSAGVLPPALRALLNRQRKPRLQELATF